MAAHFHFVMAGLDPATHHRVSDGKEFRGAQTRAGWVAASRAAMTSRV